MSDVFNRPIMEYSFFAGLILSFVLTPLVAAYAYRESIIEWIQNYVLGMVFDWPDDTIFVLLMFGLFIIALSLMLDEL